jgi:hypothetical protein
MNENTKPLMVMIMAIASGVIAMLATFGLVAILSMHLQALQPPTVPTVEAVGDCHYENGVPFCVVEIAEGWDF